MSFTCGTQSSAFFVARLACPRRPCWAQFGPRVTLALCSGMDVPPLKRRADSGVAHHALCSNHLFLMITPFIPKTRPFNEDGCVANARWRTHVTWGLNGYCTVHSSPLRAKGHPISGFTRRPPNVHTGPGVDGKPLLYPPRHSARPFHHIRPP
jgi:hypothetical protein